MRVKLIIVLVYVAAALLSGTTLVNRASAASQDGQMRADRITLDKYGYRGIVVFDHDKHKGRINPDPNAVFKAKPSVACIGCHHTRDKATGVIQLWQCTSCHRGQGDPNNPVGKDFDSEWSKTAYHNLCIACHISSNKGPVKCGDCHQAQSQSTMQSRIFGGFHERKAAALTAFPRG